MYDCTGGKPLKVIGYEGRRPSDVIVNYGAAGVELDDGRIANSCWGGGRTYDEEGRKELFESSSFQPLEEPIIVEAFPESSFILDLPTRLAAREPYALGDGFSARLNGVLGRSSGKERSYYLFESLEKCTMWLAHLHFRGFTLQPDE